MDNKLSRSNWKITMSFGFVLLLGFLTMSQYANIHDTWDKLLKKHVLSGKVDYQGFKADLGKFNTYLKELSKADISNYSQKKKLAFWINAYNAYMIKLILNNYPLKSILDISQPWKQKICKVAGKVVDFDFIRHKILRIEHQEPRIHFAIVNASIGSPDLQPFAFRANMIDAQLGYAAKRFFGSEKYFKVLENEEDGCYIYIHINNLFKWFDDDFGSNKKERVAFIFPYTEGENQRLIEKSETIKIIYKEYDWNLNDK